jgi:hypothetical protein
MDGWGSLMITRFFSSVARKRASNPFPDFDKILDFTSAGSESSTSVNVNGDTDLEYKIIVRSLNSAQPLITRLNNDSTSGHYGYQQLVNSAGTVSAGRGTTSNIGTIGTLAETIGTILTPVGFIKTAFWDDCRYTSGTTMGNFNSTGYSFNDTSNITVISVAPVSGNHTAGTRIIVYRRRVN